MEKPTVTLNRNSANEIFIITRLLLVIRKNTEQMNAINKISGYMKINGIKTPPPIYLYKTATKQAILWLIHYISF